VNAEESSGARPGRLLRADAERNRQRILAAAAELFTERGLEPSLDDVFLTLTGRSLREEGE